MTEVQISTSIDSNDYEILIRKRGEGQYAAYCPQLNLMLSGTLHEEVRQMMMVKVEEHILDIKTKS
jgi:hypothetical protein